MMESETPPASLPRGVGDPKVSSRRSPDLLRPDADTSAAPSPVRATPLEDDEKGPEQSGARPNTLSGLLEQAALSEGHRTLMGMVLEKISSATSRLRSEEHTSELQSQN